MSNGSNGDTGLTENIADVPSALEASPANENALEQPASSVWWNGLVDPALLRLLIPNQGWTAYSDELGDDNQTVVTQGSRRAIESALLSALNATNLMLLTGAGSSFCAVNATGHGAPGMNDLWDAAEQAVGVNEFKEIVALFPTMTSAKNIEKLLSLAKIFVELHGDSEQSLRVTRFISLSEKAILARVNFVDRQTELPHHSAIVRKFGRRGLRRPRAKIFTTNYDLCFEEAARRQRFTPIDGFSHSLDQVYDRSLFDYDIVRRERGKDAPDYIENVFQLYKLHGSLDWRRLGGEIIRSRGPEGDPVLIYPRSSKYQEAFEAPYLDMMGSFQTALRESDTSLLISGFGFNDDHISRPILSALEANLSLRLIICDICFIDQAALAQKHHAIESRPLQNKFLDQIQRLAGSGDSRIHLMNGRFSELAYGIPDLVGETDRERHVTRIRSLRDEANGAVK